MEHAWFIVAKRQNDESPIELTPEQITVIQKCQSDFSQSLIEEMECMFRNLNMPNTGNQHSKKHHLPSTRSQTLGPFSKKKIQSDVKPMSAHDQKTLETAVALANEITSRSMNDLDCNGGKVPPSPNERSKFTFKFPSMSHPQASQEQVKQSHGKTERRNFSQEAQSVPDLQSTITEESRIAYHSLIEQPTASSSLITQMAQDNATIHAGFRSSKRHLQTLGNAHARQSSLCSTETGHRKGEKSTHHHHQVINVLPLPSKGSKPQLVDKTRHIRIHPLVMTPNMSNPVETDKMETQPEDQRCCLHDHKTNNFGAIYMNLHNFEYYRNIEANIENENNLMKKHYFPHCGFEPDYVNISRDTEDVCDGPVSKMEPPKVSDKIPMVIISDDKHTNSNNPATKKLETGDIVIQDNLGNQASVTLSEITKTEKIEQTILLQLAEVPNVFQTDLAKETDYSSYESTKNEETELATSLVLAEFPVGVQGKLDNEGAGSSSDSTEKEETNQATLPQPAEVPGDIQDNSDNVPTGSSSESTKKEKPKQTTPPQPADDPNNLQEDSGIEAAGTSSESTKKEETEQTESESCPCGMSV